MEKRRRAWIGAGFATALALLTAVASFSLRNLSESRRSADWVAHTHEVRRSLGGILQGLLGMESNARGCHITGDERFLEHYRAAQAVLSEDLSRLRHLTADDPRQRGNIVVIEGLIERKRGVVAVAALRRGSGTPARTLAAFLRGKLVMEDARRAISRMLERPWIKDLRS